MSGALTLLTGATGFVGSAVARALLARGYRVRALVRPRSDRRNVAGLDLTLAEGDLTDPASLVAAVQGCRLLVHVAADYRIWVPDPEPMLRANVAGTRALMLACLDAGVGRVVHCSSVAALGLTGDGSLSDEATPVSEASVIGIYKKSKYRAEQAVLELVRTRGLPAVHVDDVAEGHLLALERGRVGERYILGGDNLDMAALLALVAEAAGRRPPRIRLPVAALWPVALACEALARFGVPPVVVRDHLRMARKKMFFSSAKAIAELGYAPRPARAAVEDAVAWFRANGVIPA